MLCYVSNNEVLWGWYSLKWLALAYVTTSLTVVLWKRYAPHSNDGVEKKTGASLTRLLSYMVPDIRRFAVVIFFLVISSLGEMAIPYYTGRMTDWIMSEENPDAFFSAITAMTLITVMSAVSEFVCDLIYNVTMSKIHMRIQSLVFRSVLRQEIAFFDTASTEEYGWRPPLADSSKAAVATEPCDIIQGHVAGDVKRRIFVLSDVCILALKVCILYYGAKLVTSDDVSSGDLVAFVLYELQFTSAIEVLISYYPHVKKAVGASEKIFEYMDRKPAMTTPGTLAPNSLKGHILFNNVSFAYPGRPDTMVLKIALVSQEPMLFARSVEENIAYGLGKPCQEDVKNAAKLANAHEFISELKEGYNTGEHRTCTLSCSMSKFCAHICYIFENIDAGEKGGQLSGGQKQRVAIARALLRDPSVLILDDATSSLDTESEHMVQSAIFNRRQNCSILVIAHRLSTVEKADRIIVLEDGRVVEQGTHKELLQNQGTYYLLIQKMMKGFDRSGNQESECE
ncbi:ABCB9 protein, partial [Polypterus senegalus]